MKWTMTKHLIAGALLFAAAALNHGSGNLWASLAIFAFVVWWVMATLWEIDRQMRW